METRPLCRFLLMGKCKYDAETCSSSHSTPEGISIAELRKTIPCPFYNGEKPNRKCRHQERCWFAHSDIPLCLPTSDPNENDLQCGICLQSVVGRGQRFALFTECDHTFCFSCAKSWHKNKERRESVFSKGDSDLFIRKNNYKLLFRHSCPLCRKVSLNIIPSKRFLTGDQKEAYIQHYIEERGARVCCNGTFASCQFGDECYYRHCNQEEESFTHVNRRPFLSTEIPPYATVEDSSTSYSFWNDIASTTSH
ncbi:hypothetical protein CTEN210_18483 [Chaetoceros tenuissimus]|uniref:RING-type E3 ubiquitin transferase n=1 Tax=Chaetoceros tenuissimus TaxID=426638 RepID=A0AAD3DCI8_9STRA|nr:hypothetical protein CTEN210_18483 [Chaetoceros tenuissimus]